MVQQLHKGKDLTLTSTGLQELAVSMCPMLPFSGRLSLAAQLLDKDILNTALWKTTTAAAET